MKSKQLECQKADLSLFMWSAPHAQRANVKMLLRILRRVRGIASNIWIEIQ